MAHRKHEILSTYDSLYQDVPGTEVGTCVQSPVAVGSWGAESMVGVIPV